MHPDGVHGVVRSLDPGFHTIIIRGDKLPASTFTIEVFEEFAHRYGVNYIVLEHTAEYSSWRYTEEPHPWDSLRTSPSPSMVLERTIPLTSSRRSFNGDLYVYRFTNPSANPDGTLKVPSFLMGDSIDIKF